MQKGSGREGGRGGRFEVRQQRELGNQSFIRAST